jgi:hypothetical protein
MMIDYFSHNWALVIGSALALLITLFVLVRVVGDSAPGRLRTNLRELRRRYRAFVKAQEAVQRAGHKLKSLQDKSQSVKPRRLQEAAGTLQDAKALQKIAEDRVLVAENHVRKMIVEEFSPKRQEALRKKYLRRPEPKGKPFTF